MELEKKNTYFNSTQKTKVGKKKTRTIERKITNLD